MSNYQNAIDAMSQKNPLVGLNWIFETYSPDIAKELDLSKETLQDIQEFLKKASQKDVKEFASEDISAEEIDEMVLTRERFLSGIKILKNHNISLVEKENLHHLLNISEDLAKLIENVKSEEELPTYSLQDLLGISKEKIESIYQLACEYYAQKHYTESLDIALLLTQINPFFSNIWMLIGLCSGQMQKFESALLAYSMSIILEKSNVTAYLYSIECYLELKEYTKAQDMIDYVRKQSDLFSDTNWKDTLVKLSNQIKQRKR